MAVVDYTQDNYHEVRHKDLIVSERLRSAWGGYAKKYYFDNVGEDSVILEFGGGLGANLVEVAKTNEVWMVEPSAKARDVASSYGVNVVADLSEIKDISFDYILCRHVLEHLNNPCEYMKNIGLYLKESGEALFVLPVEDPYEKPCSNEIDHHLYSWNPRIFHNFANECGYDVVDYWFGYFGGKKKLLPVYDLFGGEAYSKLVWFVGRVFGFNEYVFRLRKK